MAREKFYEQNNGPCVESVPTPVLGGLDISTELNRIYIAEFGNHRRSLISFYH